MNLISNTGIQLFTIPLEFLSNGSLKYFLRMVGFNRPKEKLEVANFFTVVENFK